MKEYNSLLQRQIKKSKWKKEENQSQELAILLDMINDAYFDFEEEKMLLERSIEISSREYQESIEETHKLQAQLIQKEKMAGVGQLSAGIAHEINNPLGFVQSNMETLQKYMDKIQELNNWYQNLMRVSERNTEDEWLQEQIQNIRYYVSKNNMNFIFQDINEILPETADGLNRISKIVYSLLGFSRKGMEGTSVDYDLNKGIIDTLTIANNEIKYYAEVKKQLEEIPFIKTFSGEINQVILDIILNSVYAIKVKGERGVIGIHTYACEEYVNCEISDNGIGMEEAVVNKIFEPFFTTKPVGDGTGLGLSIAYDIIVNRHYGQIIVQSEVGKGSTFIIRLPIHIEMKNHMGEEEI
jgi:Signal transduction histidine kinase regulating C4-dicarboxylate transport system